MTFRRTLMVLILSTLALLSGCGNEGSDDRDNGSDRGIEPATYVVTGVTEDGEPRALVSGTEVRLRFDEGRLTVTAGCNTMSGAASLDGTRLTVEPMSMTEMGCDQARMEQDSWLAGLFEKPVQFMSGTEATLVSGGTVLALTDREKVSPDRPLVGTKWLLDGFVDGDAASSVPQGAVAYLTFEDGQVLVYDGCNGGSAPVTVEGDEIVIGDRTTTLRACIDTREQVANTFGEVFAGTVTYAIEERSLTITKGDQALTFRAVDKFPAHD